ncbi:MAG TPA: dihydrofolate reductase family protein [Candidatus Limnocylindria bacterium]|nr:dihydrofolate reductase family protein [Candidatus Limnocylindria bacterium]
MSHASQRPFVLVNMAMTADGKIATANRAVTTFGSARDARHLYELRATADAILCGARTIEESNATLGNGGEVHRRARLRRGLAEYPLRVVASGSGSLSSTAKIWEKDFSPIIVLVGRQAPKRNLTRLEKLGAQVWVSPAGEVDFGTMFRRLHSEFGVKRLLCEGGGGLNDSLFRARLVDELHLTLCPRVIGGRKAPTIVDGVGCKHLKDAAPFELKSVRRHGDELFLVYAALR